MMKRKTTGICVILVAVAFLIGAIVGSLVPERLVVSETNRISVHYLDHWGRMQVYRYFVRKVEFADNSHNLEVWGPDRVVDGFAFETFRIDGNSTNMVVSYWPSPREHGVFQGQGRASPSEGVPGLFFVEGFLLKNDEKSFEVAPHMLPERLYVTGQFSSGISDVRWKLLSMLEE